jgi:hypothetical protein
MPQNTHLIRLATDADADSLGHLAELTSQAPLVGRVLVAQVDGATVSVDDGRTLADPRCFIGYLLPRLRARAQALIAYEAEPSLRARMVAALPEGYRSRAAGQAEHGSRRDSARRATGADHRRRQVRTASPTASGSSPSPGRS